MHRGMRRPLLAVVSACLLLLAACGEAEPRQGAKRAKEPIGPGQVIENAAALETASVRGRAFPVGDTQFVLAGAEQSIFVFADPAVVRGIRRPGQEVVVTGRVERLVEEQAIELADEVATLSEARGPAAAARRPPEVLRARRNSRAPYLRLERLAPAGAAGSP